jgi:hypothetical protein
MEYSSQPTNSAIKKVLPFNMRDIITELVELVVKTDDEYLLERVPIN